MRRRSPRSPRPSPPSPRAPSSIRRVRPPSRRSCEPTKATAPWRGVIREYADRLDVTDATPVVTLGEGGTPLLPAPALSRRTGADVWVKFEGMNPTGSFKDRGMTMAVTKAVEHGAKAVICASTGNTSASAAAYADARGHHGRRARARGQDRDGQAQPGHRAQRPADPGRRATSTTASTSPATSPRTTPCTS